MSVDVEEEHLGHILARWLPPKQLEVLWYFAPMDITDPFLLTSWQARVDLPVLASEAAEARKLQSAAGVRVTRQGHVMYLTG